VVGLLATALVFMIVRRRQAREADQKISVT